MKGNVSVCGYCRNVSKGAIELASGTRYALVHGEVTSSVY